MLSSAAQSLRPRPFGASHSSPSSISFLAARCRRGFTLVELLTVIAIIGILSGITFGVVKGVNERAAVGQARAELATLSQALESYKRQYGDYPRATTNAAMLQSLIGKLGPKGDPMNGKTFIDVAQLTLSSTTSSPFTVNTITVIDPWGRDYIYNYNKANSAWRNQSFVLLSTGPDGKSYGSTSAPNIGSLLEGSTGVVKADAQSDIGAADNIYANR